MPIFNYYFNITIKNLENPSLSYIPFVSFLAQKLYGFTFMGQYSGTYERLDLTEEVVSYESFTLSVFQLCGVASLKIFYFFFAL